MDTSRRCNVLLIDDDRDHAALISLILTREYHDAIMIAPGGPQGIERARQKPPDLILVRLMLLAGGLDGCQVCERLKADPATRGVPVLLFAAKPPGDVYAEAQRCGAAGYLEQPFRPAALCAAREALVRGETYYPENS